MNRVDWSSRVRTKWIAVVFIRYGKRKNNIRYKSNNVVSLFNRMLEKHGQNFKAMHVYSKATGEKVGLFNKRNQPDDKLRW